MVEKTKRDGTEQYAIASANVSWIHIPMYFEADLAHFENTMTLTVHQEIAMVGLLCTVISIAFF